MSRDLTQARIALRFSGLEGVWDYISSFARKLHAADLLAKTSKMQSSWKYEARMHKHSQSSDISSVYFL